MAAGSGHAAEYLRRDELRVVHDLTCDLASGQVGQGRRDIVEGECLARGERRGGSVKAAILGEDDRGRLGEVSLGGPGDRSVSGHGDGGGFRY